MSGEYETSPASVSESQMYYFRAKEGNPIIYKKIIKENDEIIFYFNLTNELFLCEARFENNDVKMTGNLEVTDGFKVKLLPRYGLNIESEDWIDTSNEEIKSFDISTDEIIFEGQTLKKVC